MLERHMDGGWGRFIRKPNGGQVWMWQEYCGWSLNGVHLSLRAVDADYKPAPLTILSDEARGLLIRQAASYAGHGYDSPIPAQQAEAALASMGLGPDGQPLPEKPLAPTLDVDEVWQRPDGVALKVANAPESDDGVLVPMTWEEGEERPFREDEMVQPHGVVYYDKEDILKRWRKVRNADGTEVKP